ncbi:MAG TPA: PDDEXK nuclease domain-containing protein [Methanocorpusculum sp.]|nr:PDDEXK nuclease domain-containing protein [Methanocorpusculum sp.]
MTEYPVLRTDFLSRIHTLLQNARQTVKTAVNTAMVYTYYEIGRLIVEEEQNGNSRAEYGKYIIQQLSRELTGEYGKGYSITNLKQMRQFYTVYSQTQIGQTLSDQFKTGQTIDKNSPQQAINSSEPQKFCLSWSHYLFLMRIQNSGERQYYEIESYKNDWSLNELKRQYNSSLYERLSLSKNKEEIMRLASVGQIIETPRDIVKDPYVLEFLGLPELPQYSETELENRIITHLQNFLLELGKGFTFVGRQVRFTFDEDHYKVDLVFFNRILKCFVLFDLKIGELKHQDIGQMQMYVHYYDRCVKLPEENPTIGIILCKDKKQSMVEMTLPENNTQIFASKYETVLPSKEEFRKLLQSQD